MDKFIHPCLRAGAQTSTKNLFFRHNSGKHCRDLLKENINSYDIIFIVIESIYSTDGDLGDLPAFVKIRDEFGSKVKLVVDDAHGVGAIGPNAGGVEDYWGMVGVCDYICGTLSKACSAQGGFVVSNHTDVIDQLIGSPGVGFATGMNAFSAGFAHKALEWIMENGHEQVIEAKELRDYFREQLELRFTFTFHDSPARLLAVKIPHATKAIHIQEEMITRGYLVSVMVFPACSLDTSLVRMTVIPGY